MLILLISFDIPSCLSFALVLFLQIFSSYKYYIMVTKIAKIDHHIIDLFRKLAYIFVYCLIMREFYRL